MRVNTTPTLISLPEPSAPPAIPAGPLACAASVPASDPLDPYETGFLFGEKVQLQSFRDVRAVLGVLKASATVSSTGEMSPGQALRHCAQSIEMSLDGYPRMKSGLFRATLGKAASWLFLNLGFMFHSLDDPIPGAGPAEAVTLDEGIAALQNAMSRFANSRGDLKPHFAYGDLEPADYERVHAMHVANHLEGLTLS